MRAVIFLVLFIGWGDMAAQTVLPNVIVDSMIFEVKRGRQCSLALEASQEEIKALGNELLHTGTALKLSQSESSTLNDLLDNAKEGNEIQAMQFQKDLQTEKQKVKWWRRIGIIQGVGLIGILILIL